MIATNLRAVRPAERAARWLSDPSHARDIARQVASGLAKTLETLPDHDVRELMHQVVSARLRAIRVAPALGKTLALVLAGNRQQELLDVVVRLAAGAIRDNRELIREKVRTESPWWVPGVVDDKIYQRILDTVEGLLRDIGTKRRSSPPRGVRDGPVGLYRSPAALPRRHRQGRVPQGRVARRPVGRRSVGAPVGIDPAARWSAMRAGPTVRSLVPCERGLSEFGAALLANDPLLAELDDLVIDLAAMVVERYRHEIGDLIATTVAGWDPEATSRRFELAVGRDLQFVRINGTLVGGLVGLAIYTCLQLLR